MLAVEAEGQPVGVIATDRDEAVGERPRPAREERRLVRAAQRGSRDALDALVRAHWPLAYRSAYVVVRDAAAAEDIAQEALLAAIRALDGFDRRRPFGPWLHRIAVNRAIDWARARTLRAKAAAAAAAQTTAAADPHDHGPEDPRAVRLEAALDRLSPEHRAVVAMRYVVEMTPGEIARALELPRGTVNSRLRRALDRLAAGIAEEER